MNLECLVQQINRATHLIVFSSIRVDFVHISRRPGSDEVHLRPKSVCETISQICLWIRTIHNPGMSKAKIGIRILFVCFAHDLYITAVNLGHLVKPLKSYDFNLVPGVNRY